MLIPTILIFNGQIEENEYSYTIRLKGQQGEEPHTVSVDEEGKATQAAEIDSLIAAVGADSTELLLRSVREFHKAARIMFYNPATLKVVPPATRPKRLKPVMMSAEGLEEGEENRHLYRVVYEAENGPESHVFVVDGDMMSISWEDAFFEDIGQSTTHGAPLLNSVMDFFEAGHQKAELPLD